MRTPQFAYMASKAAQSPARTYKEATERSEALKRLYRLRNLWTAAHEAEKRAQIIQWTDEEEEIEFDLDKSRERVRNAEANILTLTEQIARMEKA